jgi:hypothetical protein
LEGRPGVNLVQLDMVMPKDPLVTLKHFVRKFRRYQLATGIPR